MSAKEQQALLVEIQDFLTKESNNLSLRKLRSDVYAYSDFNQKIARAFGCNVDRVHGGACIVVDRFKFDQPKLQPGWPPPVGSWDGVGDYTQNLHHILKHLIPDDLSIMMERGLIRLTENGPVPANTGDTGPDIMTGGVASVAFGMPFIVSVSLPRALLLSAIHWKLDTLQEEGPEPA